MTPRRLAIIDGHPDPSSRHFVHALADSYAGGAAISGHQLRRINVADLEFPLVRSRDGWENDTPPTGIGWAQQTILWAEHLLILYPLWLGDVPALLKGFLEQVLRPDFTFERDQKGRVRKKLAGRSARLVVTMGMPALFYRAVYGAHSVKSFERNILKFVGIRPVEHLLIGNIEADADERRRWLDELCEFGIAGT